MPVSGTALYSPLGGTPRRLHGGAGRGCEAQRRQAAAAAHRHADGAQGRRARRSKAATGKRTVNLVAITGVGFTPTFVWATADAAPRLFAFILPGFLQLDRGRLAEERRCARDPAEAGRRRGAGGLQQAARPSAAGHDADPQRARVRQREGGARRGLGRAAEGRPHRFDCRRPARAAPLTARVDAGGRVLLPGLFDMHGHVVALGRRRCTSAPASPPCATWATTTRRCSRSSPRSSAGTLLMTAHRAGRLPRGREPDVGAQRLRGQATSPARRRRSTGTPSTTIRRSRSTTRSRRTSCADDRAYAHEQGTARQRPHPGVHARAGRGGAGLRRDPAHQPAAAQLLRHADHRHAHAASASTCVGEKAADLDFDSKPVQDFIALLKAKQHRHRPDARHLRLPAPARRRDVGRPSRRSPTTCRPTSQRGFKRRRR